MSRAERALGQALRGFCVLLFVGIQLLMIAAVVNRFFPVGSLDWSDEVLELMLVWLAFTGTAEVWRIRAHFSVEIVPLMLKGRSIEPYYRGFLVLAGLVFVAVFTYQSFNLFLRADDVSPYFSWPRRLWYASMPVNGFLMMLFSLRDFALLACARRAPVMEAQPGD